MTIIRMENAEVYLTDLGKDVVLTVRDEDYRVLAPISKETARALQFSVLEIHIKKEEEK